MRQSPVALWSRHLGRYKSSILAPKTGHSFASNEKPPCPGPPRKPLQSSDSLMFSGNRSEGPRYAERNRLHPQPKSFYRCERQRCPSVKTGILFHLPTRCRNGRERGSADRRGRLPKGLHTGCIGSRRSRRRLRDAGLSCRPDPKGWRFVHYGFEVERIGIVRATTREGSPQSRNEVLETCYVTPPYSYALGYPNTDGPYSEKASTNGSVRGTFVFRPRLRANVLEQLFLDRLPGVSRGQVFGQRPITLR